MRHTAAHIRTKISIKSYKTRGRHRGGRGYRLLASVQTLEGSFSAVSTATIATKYSFCSVFRDLQDLQSFAPLRSQNFNKNSSNFLMHRKLVGARSHLYRRRFLQPNTHFAAFFAIYRIYTLSHRSKLRNLAKLH